MMNDASCLCQFLCLQASSTVEEGQGDGYPSRKELTKQGSVLSKYFPEHTGRRYATCSCHILVPLKMENGIVY